jgi:hypothetical protein
VDWYSSMRLRIRELVRRNARSSSMRHCSEIKMRMSSGRPRSPSPSGVLFSGALRRLSDSMSKYELRDATFEAYGLQGLDYGSV